ncbi:GerMN domain-containing protein [Agromyces soli]
MRRRLASAAAATAALIALLLAGCASIPSSGGVNAGDPGTGDEALDLDLQAPSPVDGATQEEILRGFINAATSPRSNYAVARQYLAPGFASEWQPSAGATIDRFSDRETERVDATSLQIDAVPAAELGEFGQYRLAESQAPLSLAYHFVEVDGEWRIDQAPDGILMDESNFVRVYRTHSLYFYDPAYQYAVPDVRWFAGRESLQTSIVRALLAGPADWLDPGVESAFPEGVVLDPDAVPVDGGVAIVSLEGVGAADEAAVQRMRFQLEQSLESVRDVQNVALSLDGTAQNGELVFSAETDPKTDPRAVVSDGTVFGRLSANGESIEPIEGLSDQVAALRPDAAALGHGERSAAVRSADGVYLVRVGEQPVQIDARSGLIAPAIDGAGYVWTAAPDASAALVASDGETRIPLVAPWNAASISAIEISADGTRIIALLEDGGRARFVAASIARDADGVPQSIGPVPLVLSDEPGAAADLTWIDSSTAASLTVAGDGTTRLVTQVLGALATRRDGPTGGVQLDSGVTARELRVLTSGGELDTVSGVAWQTRATGIVFLASQLAG